MNLIEFDEILCDVDFGQELGVYTEVFIHEVIDHLSDQIDNLQAELDFRGVTKEKLEEQYQLKKFRDESVRTTMKNGGVQCEDPKCVCHEKDEEE